MSLLNLLSDKISSSVAAYSRSLSKFTDTTFAEANTSLANVLSTATTAAKNSIQAAGAEDSTFYSPVTTMRDRALQLDPSNASIINSSSQNAINSIGNSFTSLIPGVNNSLVDVQSAVKGAISSGVSNFSVSLNTINPSVLGGINSLGISLLPDAGRVSDLACTAGFIGASNSLTFSISNINSTIADKAQSLLASAPVDSTIRLPSATAASNTSVASLKSAPSTIAYSTAKVPLPTGINTTDVIYQEVKIYVEGVQVPFESYSITQSIGNLPQASFQIPPSAGLMDIARYYQPKVHIFYTDANNGGDRLLFWGHIIAVNYAYSQQNSMATIMFECVHKNALMQQLTFEWSAGGSAHATQGNSFTNNNPDQATLQLYNFNSALTMNLALQGLTGLQTEAKDLVDPINTNVIEADPTKLSVRFKNSLKRFYGMPSCIMNLWNQAKREVFAQPSLNTIFTKMYLPLIEDGVCFFDRISGHYFLENQIQYSKLDHCVEAGKPEAGKYPTMLPHSFRTDIMSAKQREMALNAINSQLGFSNELTTLYDLLSNFYYIIEYDMVTLASPAEVPIDPTVNVNTDDKDIWRAQNRMAVETIVKPQLPFYYAPICNVLLPNMFSSIQISQDENNIPTRITSINTAASMAEQSPNALGINYRAPQSIRESVALGRELVNNTKAKLAGISTLKDTTASSYNVPGKYELGRGIKHKKMYLPEWLTRLATGSNEERAANNDQLFPNSDTLEAKNIEDLRSAWIDRYGYSDQPDDSVIKSGPDRKKYRNTLNPYSSESQIMAYERLLFGASDYEYSKEIMRSKTGSVDCLFNPYIVPGYPMDIIAKSPNHPSFHCLCASVSHSGSSRSISTSVSFMAAMTYTEMSNYFIQPMHPWLQTALKMVNVSKSATASSTSTLDEQPTVPTVDNIVAGATSVVNGVDFGLADVADPTKNSTLFGLTPSPNFDSNTGDVDTVTQGLIGNDRAKAVADQFYKQVLGVGAADPGLIYDFTNGTAAAIKRDSGIWSAGAATTTTIEGGQNNDNLSGVGGLRLVNRQIESRNSMEDKFGIKFIDLTPGNYTGTSNVYESPLRSNRNLLEPGASLFLDYEEINSFISGVIPGSDNGTLTE